MNANEAKKFADAHATGEIHWASGDPTDDRKNGITAGDLKLLVGEKYGQNLSDAQIVDLTNRVDDYTAHGGKVFSRKDAPPATIANPNEQFAEKNNYDASSVLRNRLENKLPNPQPIPQPAPTPIKTDRVKPVSEMSSGEKIEEALSRMIPMLPDSMREKVEAMTTPEAMTAMTAVLGLWAAGHYVGASEVIDALAIIGLAAAGVEVADVGQKLYDGANLAMAAQTSREMDAAAKKFADAFGGATVDVAAAIVIKKAGGLMEQGINNLPKMPPPSPQFATPNGISFPSVARASVLETRLPIWATPTTAPSTGLLSERLFGNRKPEDNLLYSKQANPLGEGKSIAESESYNAPKGAGDWKFNPKVDLDWRGQGKSIQQALTEAFSRTGTPKQEFTVTKWATDKNGKSFPVEWRAKNGAEVNIDVPHKLDGPAEPHVGYQTPGKRSVGGAVRGHILLDEVPVNRSTVKE